MENPAKISFSEAMHPLTRHVLANNNTDLSGFAPLFIGGRKLGALHPAVAEAVKDSSVLRREGDAFHLNGNNFEDYNAALRVLLMRLVEKKILRGERREMYAVEDVFEAKPVALADRALVPALGLRAHGIHCNGYIRTDGARASGPLAPAKAGGTAQNIKLWIARRSMTSHVDPGKLDHLVAGGQPHGLSLRENLAKEAKEEAGIPPALVEKAQAVGTVTYTRAETMGVRRDVLFLFDLELPADFIPQNTDGEASGFQLMEVDEVRERLEKTDDFKFNVPLVLIDFLIRHGFIAANEPGYAELVRGLRL